TQAKTATVECCFSIPTCINNFRFFIIETMTISVTASVHLEHDTHFTIEHIKLKVCYCFVATYVLFDNKLIDFISGTIFNKLFLTIALLIEKMIKRAAFI